MRVCGDRKLRDSQVPIEYREIAIHSGYRHPGLTFSQSIESLFTLHNETFNIWTHIVSLLLYVGYTCHFLLEPRYLSDSHHHAVLCLLFSCCIFPFCSAIAHLFASMSPVVRHSCFMLDYLGITMYAFGACIANNIHALPRAWQGGIFERFFLVFMFISCLVCIIVSCHTRFMPRNQKKTKVLRFGAFALPYIFGMLPCMYRVLHCREDNSCQGATYYNQHFFDTIFTVLSYGAHVPEVIFPGYFDVFFQSHSIFHVVVALGTFHHLQGIIVDMNTRPLHDHSFLPCSPALPLISLVVLNMCIVLYFIRKMHTHHYKCHCERSH